jgi:PIN domain nuclease of toxin-antitoxin system
MRSGAWTRTGCKAADVTQFDRPRGLSTVTRQVCLTMRALDFQPDPADQIIAGTSLTHQIPRPTRDARIRRSRAVKCV